MALSHKNHIWNKTNCVIHIFIDLISEIKKFKRIFFSAMNILSLMNICISIEWNYYLAGTDVSLVLLFYRISGQTWLQLQQQKLRAKKQQQHPDDTQNYERIIRTEYNTSSTTGRPARSRSSASERYDGYVSDTAAFHHDRDEVDYRRPLHVQTPANRNSERNYHTMTTTTTTTKERPFVAVRRAHEQSKQGYSVSYTCFFFMYENLLFVSSSFLIIYIIYLFCKKNARLYCTKYYYFIF